MAINISGLPDGRYEHELTASTAELNLDEAGITGDVKARVELDRHGDQLFVRLETEAKREADCDRCLDPVSQSLTGRHAFLVVYEPKPTGGRRAPSAPAPEPVESDDDEVRRLAPDANLLDLSGEVRETVLLSVPAKTVCRHDCAGICAGCGHNLNTQSCVCAEPPTDPRWAALRKLLPDA